MDLLLSEVEHSYWAIGTSIYEKGNLFHKKGRIIILKNNNKPKDDKIMKNFFNIKIMKFIFVEGSVTSIKYLHKFENSVIFVATFNNRMVIYRHRIGRGNIIEALKTVFVGFYCLNLAVYFDTSKVFFKENRPYVFKDDSQ